jgi:hypothetical protein
VDAGIWLFRRPPLSRRNGVDFDEGGKMKEPTQFITNEKGDRIAVVIPMEEYEQLLEELEELDELHAFDEAEASGETPIPFERTVSETNRTPK